MKPILLYSGLMKDSFSVNSYPCSAVPVEACAVARDIITYNLALAGIYAARTLRADWNTITEVVVAPEASIDAAASAKEMQMRQTLGKEAVIVVSASSRTILRLLREARVTSLDDYLRTTEECC